MDIFDEPAVIESAPPAKVTARRWLPWVVTLIIFVVLAIIFSPLALVQNGHQGITTFFGDVQGKPLPAGLHLKYPLLRVHQFDTRTQIQEISLGVVTSDLQLATLTVTLEYRLDPKELVDIYLEVGEEVETQILEPLTKAGLTQTATEFTAADLVLDRDALQAALMTELTTRFADSGLIFTDVQIVGLEFATALQEAYANTASAEQVVEAALLRQQAAELDQQTEWIMADEELERIRTIGDSLRGHEAYFYYEILRKWDGTTPLYLGPIAPVQIVNEYSD